MTRRVFTFLLTFLALAFGPSAQALDPSLTFFQYEFSYPADGDAGVPYEVYDVVEDRDGFLWLASVRGLMRYDGRETTLYRVSSYPGVLSNSPQRLLVDSLNRVFVSSDGGVSAYQDGEFVAVLESRNAATRIHAMAEGDDGTVWLGGESGLWAYANDELTSASGSSPLDQVHALLWHGGRLYVGQRGLISVLGDGDDRVLRLPPGLDTSTVQDLVFHQGRLWAATLEGLVYLEDGAFQPVVDAALQGHSFTALLSDRDQNLWFSGPRSIGRFYPDGTLELPDVGDDSLGFVPQVTNIFEDRAGTHWHSSRLFGLSSLSDTPVVRVSSSEGLPSPNVTAIAAGANGQVYLATDAGIAALEENVATVVIDEAFRSGNVVRAMLPTPHDSLWVGTERSLREYDLVTERWRDNAALEGLDSATNALAYGSEGVLWIATDHGLFALQDGGLHSVLDTSDLSIQGLHVDARGDLWIGAENGLAKLVGGRFEWQVNEFAGTDAGIVAIAETPTGAVVAASSGAGVLVQHGSEWLRFDETKGLPPENLISLEMRGHELWLVTSAGVFRSDVDLAQVDPTGSLSLQAVITSDDYRGNYAHNCCRGDNAQSTALTQGSMVVATDDGAVVFDTGLGVSSPAMPKPYLKRVSYADESNSPADNSTLVLPARQRSIRIEYSALDLLNGEKIRFRYRLLGLGDEWIDAGNASTAEFPGLPPGDFVFELQASARPGVWSETTAALAFSASARLQETPTFRALLWVASLLAVFGLVWWRMTALRMRHHKLEEGVRKRTQELHSLNAQLKDANRNLYEASQTDPLTGLVNRRFFDRPSIADQITGRVGGQGLVVMLDIDHFKRVNDAWGHAAGDEILSQFASVLLAATRDTDIVARWGGEEFLLVCRTGDDDATTLLSRLVSTIADHKFRLPRGSVISITSSIGAVKYPLNSDDELEARLGGLIELADNALYCVKVNKRNGWALVEAGDVPVSDLESASGNSGLRQMIRSGQLNWRSSRSEISASIDDTVTRLRALKSVS